MMKMLYVLSMVLIFAACLTGGGCQRPLHADAPVLDGAIPRCAVLLSEARTEYRDTAKTECAAIETPEQRKKSGACKIDDYVRYCNEWQ